MIQSAEIFLKISPNKERSATQVVEMQMTRVNALFCWCSNKDRGVLNPQLQNRGGL